MNGWFPKLRNDGVIASGNAGIWLTSLAGEPSQVSPVGIGPIWCGQQLVYNRNDGTTQVGVDKVLPIAYNDYIGCDCGQWAGFKAVGLGQVDRYNGSSLTASLPMCCAPRFYGLSFGYLTPYQPPPTNIRTLLVDGVPRASGVIIDWVADRCGGSYLYVVAVGTYGKDIYDNKGNNVTIRSQKDEAPIVNFTNPADGLPWMLSGTTDSGTFVRMIYSAGGYVIPGELFFPDARIIGSRLHVVGSLANGQPRDVWIDFSAPMVDLRKV